MKYILAFIHTSIFIIICITLICCRNSYALSYACEDIKIIFTRGSSENPSSLFLNDTFSFKYKDLENVAGSFFQSFKTYLDRDYPSVNYDAVSIHNFPDLYSNEGYRAVGIFGPKTVNNIFESELYWWPLGEYRESVAGGIDEVSGFLKDQIKDCPDQLLVVGGYSQGAHVMGESLFRLTEEEQGKIHSVALFGDPKYIASSATNLTSVDYLKNTSSKPVPRPWKRGTASLIDRGVLDARVPYLPIVLENRTLSWCFNDDFICTGGSGVLQSSRPLVLQQSSTLNKDDLGAGHKRYSSYGAPEAAQEIIQRLSPRLNYIEAKNGGKDVSKSFVENIPVTASSKPIDIMLMLNSSYGVDDVLGQLRNNSYSVLPPFLAYYSNVYIGIGEYSETGSLTNRQPRSLIRQQPTSNYETLITSMNRKLSYGDLSGGGLDLPEPHQLGIEKAIRATNWRPEAEKHVVVLTDRPLSPSITFNLCDSVSLNGFGIQNSATCFQEIDNLSRSSRYHSEWCKQIYKILTQNICTFEGTANYQYLIHRSESSLIELMQASDVAVSFVMPHAYRGDVEEVAAKAKLRELSGVGGGKYIEYSAFTKANYTDMYWQILNHKINKISLKNIQYFDNKNSFISETSKNNPLQLFTNSKQLFTVTGSNIFDLYSWDLNGDGLVDETTTSPQIEHSFESGLSNKYISVTGSSSGSSSSVRVPVTVVEANVNTNETLPQITNISARRSSGIIQINWQCSDGAVLFMDLDLDNHPDISAPCSQGALQLEDSSLSSIFVWVENYIGRSERVTVNVENIPDETNNIDGDDNQSGGSNNNGDANNQIDDNQTDGTNNENDSNQEYDNPEDTNNSSDEATSNDKNSENNVKYNESLTNNTEKIIRMLQQNQSETNGNNTSTYNPQKAQGSDQQASPGAQKTAELNESTLAIEFDAKTVTNNFASFEAYMGTVVFVIIPLVLIFVKIKMSSKK